LEAIKYPPEHMLLYNFKEKKDDTSDNVPPGNGFVFYNIK
jgi:hypothetical protein